MYYVTMVTVTTMVTVMTMVTMTTMVTVMTMVTVQMTMVTIHNSAFVSIIDLEKKTLNNAQIYYHVDQCDTDIFCFIVVLSSFRRN